MDLFTSDQPRQNIILLAAEDGYGWLGVSCPTVSNHDKRNQSMFRGVVVATQAGYANGACEGSGLGSN